MKSVGDRCLRLLGCIALVNGLVCTVAPFLVVTRSGSAAAPVGNFVFWMAVAALALTPLQLLALWVVLSSRVRQMLRVRTLRRRTLDVLEHRRLAIAFQPIVEIASGEVIGYEALSRFTAEPAATPDVWFAAADEVGLGLELELLAVRAALSAAEGLPGTPYVAINVSPAMLMHPRLLTEMLQARIPPTRLVLEVTEHVAIDDYTVVLETRSRLRQHGIRLAVDDAGSGYSSLRHIVALTPDIIKLDRALVAGVDHDVALRALVAAMVMYSLESAAVIVGEGVETTAEYHALGDLGVNAAQGYLLGRPSINPTTGSGQFRTEPETGSRSTSGKRAVSPACSPAPRSRPSSTDQTRPHGQAASARRGRTAGAQSGSGHTHARDRRGRRFGRPAQRRHGPADRCVQLPVGRLSQRCCRSGRGLGEGIEHPPDERGHVLRTSARGQVPVPDQLLVEPRGARVDQVVADPRPGREGATVQEAGGRQHPRPVAERRDGLVVRHEPADELPRRGGLPEEIRTDEAAGQQQPVVVTGISLVDRLVHLHPARGHVQVHPADASAPQGHDVHRGAGRLQDAQRNDQLDLLEAVRHQSSESGALEPAPRRHAVPFRSRLPAPSERHRPRLDIGGSADLARSPSTGASPKGHDKGGA